jgi:hypothetical protein
MKKHQYIISVAIAGFPLVVFAAGKTLHDLISSLSSYFNDALALLMGLAVVMFVWYVIRYFIQPNDKRAEAAQYIMWSLIGFFVIFSIWGLVNILISTFNLGGNKAPSLSDLKNLFPQ